MPKIVSDFLRGGLAVAAFLVCLGSLDAYSDLSDPEDYMAVFHVAVDGDDRQPGTRSQPFATLERARDAVREINETMSDDILVVIEPGDHLRKQTFLLNPNDSGRNGHRVIYRGGGKPGEARLVGGIPLRNWEVVENGIYRAPVDADQTFHTLYENGIRARKARYPNYKFDARFPMSGADYLTAIGGSLTELVWRAGDLETVAAGGLGDQANLVVWPWGVADWQKFTRRITGVDLEKRTLHVPDHSESGRAGIRRGARYYIEGVFAFLDQPGEFYLNTEEGFLYYWPRFGDPSEQRIIAPSLVRMISIEGESASQPVGNLILEGLAIGYTDTFGLMDWGAHFPWAPSADFGAQGALHLRFTEDLEIRFNRIHNIGLSGIYLERSNKRNLIYGNWIHDIGISGIVLAYHRQRRSHPDDINEANLIENNRIHRLGDIAVDSAGVNIWGGRANVVRHTEIFDGARYAVSLRGPYTQMRMDAIEKGMGDTNRPVTEENVIRFCHFYRVGQDSGDMGAIHMSGISSHTNHPVNYLEQILIEEVRAHPSMMDLSPNGIFFDYTDGVTDQVMRNVEVRSTANAFRTNRTDIRHVFDNCSWRNDFDPSLMQYDRIGLLDDFPAHFRTPEEVKEVQVRGIDTGESRSLRLTWENPKTSGYQGVWISAEGESNYAPRFVPAGENSVEIPRPATSRLVMLRFRTVDEAGNRSHGILIPAAQQPDPLEKLLSQGVDRGIALKWEDPGERIWSVRIVFEDRSIDPVQVPADADFVRIDDLRNNQVYGVRIHLVDTDGHVWAGPELRIAAGEGAPIPQDVAAWWTFEEESLTSGQSLGDKSNSGNTIFVEGGELELVPGRLGNGIRFDGNGSYLRVLDPTGLKIGTGDYAISLWIKRDASVRMAGRIIDFGGGTRGEWEHWGVEIDDSLAAKWEGLSLVSDDAHLSGVFRANGRRYQVRAGGFDLADEWNHVVLNIQREGEIALWLNGEKADGTPIAANARLDLAAENDFVIGRMADLDHPNLLWTGVVNQIRVYQRSLTSAEIMALFREKD